MILDNEGNVVKRGQKNGTTREAPEQEQAVQEP
jgi:hypothetical protein